MDLAAKGHIANVQVGEFVIKWTKLTPGKFQVRRSLVSHDPRILPGIFARAFPEADALVLHEPEEIPVVPVSY